LSLSPETSYALEVVPLDAPLALALVTLRPLETRAARGAARFGFTPMEGRVAEMLCRGLTPMMIARELGISIETVRCHLKQAFLKARVHRQAELVAVLLSV
jgi:DNA-binding CsgD family transcriptional regulator